MMIVSRLAPAAALLLLTTSLLSPAGPPEPGRELQEGARDPRTSPPAARAPSRIETLQLRENLYVLHWPRKKNVVVLVTDEGLLLVDNHFPREAAGIDAALKAISDQPVRYLVNTHFHKDHVGANDWWAEEATILSHRKARLRMENSDLLGGKKLDPPLEPRALPRVTFEDRLTLHLGGQEIRLIHFPNAHTDGDCVVWFPGLKVCATGDIFYSDTVPFIDLDGGGDPWKLIEAVEQLSDLLPADTTLIPGHGDVSERELLDEYGAMLTGVVARVRIEFERGATAHSIDITGALVDWEVRWGGEKLVAMKNFVGVLEKALHPK